MTYGWWEVRRDTLHSETNVLPLGEPKDFLWSPNLPPLDPVSDLSPQFCFSSDETVEGRASSKPAHGIPTSNLGRLYLQPLPYLM